MERNIKLTVEYDGSAYAGWQKQRDAITVQGELIRAVERVVRHPVDLVGAGRTDRGVHARGQVASFRTDSAIPVANLLLAFNRYLPEDVAVRAVEEAPLDFHARFSAIGKHYRYTLLRSPRRSAFDHRWSVRWAAPLAVSSMRAAALLLSGQHDFAAFATRSKSEVRSTVRTVYAITIEQEPRSPPFLHFHVLGRAFLYNMVRTIVGTLLEVGSERYGPEAIAEILHSLDRRRAGPTAPAAGLCLMEVFYDEGRLEHARARFRAAGPPDAGDVGVAGSGPAR